ENRRQRGAKVITAVAVLMPYTRRYNIGRRRSSRPIVPLLSTPLLSSLPRNFRAFTVVVTQQHRPTSGIAKLGNSALCGLASPPRLADRGGHRRESLTTFSAIRPFPRRLQPELTLHQQGAPGHTIIQTWTTLPK
ncbi:unnamed protein product, partial [Meganyctiphanes norvegica]